MPALVRRSVELNTGSVADIAFLLLSFFLMTTVIEDEKGLTLQLPEWREEVPQIARKERNVFNVHINSHQSVMIEGEISSIAGLKDRIHSFLLNYGQHPDLSESPELAVVSLKTDRGTTHQMFIHALDEIHGAYYEIYASNAGISVKQYRKLNPGNPADRKIIDAAKKDFPMNISIAEPSSTP